MTKQAYEPSESFIRLINHIGEVTVTIRHISSLPKRKNWKRDEERAYAPGVKAMIVTISEAGKLSVNDFEFNITDRLLKKTYTKTMKNMELPEDEFHFFGAIRASQEKISAETPGFLFDMATISAYAAFEVYLGDVIRQKIRVNPRVMGGGTES